MHAALLSTFCVGDVDDAVWFDIGGAHVEEFMVGDALHAHCRKQELSAITVVILERNDYGGVPGEIIGRTGQNSSACGQKFGLSYSLRRKMIVARIRKTPAKMSNATTSGYILSSPHPRKVTERTASTAYVVGRT